MVRRLLAAYRRTGADLPFGDPARSHAAAMEGYYWRIVDAAAERVVVVLCGVCQGPGGPWAVVALASEPGGFLRHAVTSPAAADPARFGASAGEVLRGSASALSVRLPDAALEARLRPVAPWPRGAFGALGIAHAFPGLTQYWHPAVPAADVEGEASIGGTRVALGGASAYVEKNWGPRFPRHWWWGHADAFRGGQAAVAFAGGTEALWPGRLPATAIVLRLRGELLRLAPPAALVSAVTTTEAWRIRARSPRYAVELEGGPAGIAPQLLPVPDLAAQTVDMRSVHHLAARLRLRVRAGRRTLFEGESPLAGLERGVPADDLTDARRAVEASPGD